MIPSIMGFIGGGHQQGSDGLMGKALYVKTFPVKPIRWISGLVLARVCAVLNQIRHGGTKLLADPGVALARILNRVMEEARYGLIFVTAVIPHQGTHSNDMGEVGNRFPFPPLVAVQLSRPIAGLGNSGG
jgi:hypothetical protein